VKGSVYQLAKRQQTKFIQPPESDTLIGSACQFASRNVAAAGALAPTKRRALVSGRASSLRGSGSTHKKKANGFDSVLVVTDLTDERGSLGLSQRRSREAEHAVHPPVHPRCTAIARTYPTRPRAASHTRVQTCRTQSSSPVGGALSFASLPAWHWPRPARAAAEVAFPVSRKLLSYGDLLRPHCVL
jgi:hypothetical protein